MDVVAHSEKNTKSNPTLDKNIAEASAALKAISHPIRMKILCVLDNRELSVQEIIEHVGTSQSNVSRHLSLLRNKDILTARKDMNRVLYRIADQHILMLIDLMHQVFCPNSNGK